MEKEIASIEHQMAVDATLHSQVCPVLMKSSSIVPFIRVIFLVIFLINWEVARELVLVLIS